MAGGFENQQESCHRIISLGFLNLSRITVWPRVCASKWNRWTPHCTVNLFTFNPWYPRAELTRYFRNNCWIAERWEYFDWSKDGFSIFVGPLESLLFLYDRLIFSKVSFSIHCSRKGNKHIHIKEEVSPLSGILFRWEMELRQTKTAEASQEDLGPSHVAQDKRHENSILKKNHFLRWLSFPYLINVRLLHQITLIITKCY